jgi:tetratricopeptide (TPR) repeat protein
MAIGVGRDIKEYLYRVYQNRGEVLTMVEHYKVAVENFNDLIGIGKRLEDERIQIQALNSKAYRLILMGDYDKSLEALECAREMIKENYDKSYSAFNHQCLAQVFRMQGYYSRAIEEIDQAIEIYRKEGVLNKEASCLSTKGLTLWRSGNVENARQELLQALKMAVQINNQSLVAGCYNNLGLVYKDMGQYDAAIDCFEKSQAIREKICELSNISSSIFNLGMVYLEIGQLDAGEKHTFNAMKLFKRYGDGAGEAMAMTNLGELFYHKEEYGKALEYFENSLALKHKLNLRSYFASSLTGVIKTCFEMRHGAGMVAKCMNHIIELLALETANERQKGEARELLEKLKAENEQQMQADNK